MERTATNICILKSFLHDIYALDCNYVEDFDAFYITNNRDDNGRILDIYLIWDRVVFAYNKYVDNLLNIQ